MSGFYDRVTMGSGWEKGQDIINQGRYDYSIYRGAAMRTNRTQAPFLGPAQHIDFYGPLTGNRVTKESFIMGRGHTLDKNPNNEVYYLPLAVFNQPPEITSTCDRIDLQPMFTRVKPSCNGLKETDLTMYMMMPGHYQNGYLGYNNVIYNHLQTRVGPPYDPNYMDPCAQNYASYAPTRSFDRYAP
jgi:hypothetical protein